MPRGRCDSCGEDMSKSFWCPNCRMWLCRFCITMFKKCKQCGNEVTG